MAKKLKTKGQEKYQKKQTKEQAHNELRLQSIDKLKSLQSTKADLIKAALTGPSTKSVKFSDSESDGDGPAAPKNLSAMMNSGSESDSDESSDSEDFFTREEKRKALAADPRFSLGNEAKNAENDTSAQALADEKHRAMSILADLTGQKQIYTSEQRDQFKDPSRKRFDPTKEFTDEPTSPTKKSKVTFDTDKPKQKAENREDKSRFIKIGGDLTDAFGPTSKSTKTSQTTGGFNFAPSTTGGFSFDPKPENETPTQTSNSAVDTRFGQFSKPVAAKPVPSSDSGSDESSSDSGGEESEVPGEDKLAPDVALQSGKSTIFVIPAKKTDAEIRRVWQGKRERLLEGVRKRWQTIRKQHNNSDPDKSSFTRF